MNMDKSTAGKGMAKILYDRRRELGLTLEEVGMREGVGKSTVRKWETGYIANMRRDKIAKLAAVLEMSPAQLMGWDEENPQSPSNAQLLADLVNQLTPENQLKILDLVRVHLAAEGKLK